MADITQTDLRAALIDQQVAGAFHGKRYAFVPVVADAGWELGIAVANEQGYSPLKGITFETHEQAEQWADGLNEHIGLSDNDAMRIVCSTMGGRRTNRRTA